MIYRSAGEATKAFHPIFKKMGWTWDSLDGGRIPTYGMIEYKFFSILERAKQIGSDDGEAGRLVVENVLSGKQTFRLNDKSWQEFMEQV